MASEPTDEMVEAAKQAFELSRWKSHDAQMADALKSHQPEPKP